MSTVHISSGGGNTAQDTTYILAEMIPRLEIESNFWQSATPSRLVNHVGRTARWRTMTNLTAQTDAIVKTYSTKDNEMAIATDAVEQTINRYGGWAPFDLADMKRAPKSFSQEIADNFAYAAMLTHETLLRAACDGSGTGFTPSMGAGTTTTQKSNAAGGTAGTLEAGDKLTAEEIFKAAGTLYENNAKPKSGGQFHLHAHSRPITQLMTDVSTTRVTWEKIHVYVPGTGGQEMFSKNAAGALNGTLIIRNNLITTATINSLTAYVNILIADWGLGALTTDDSFSKPDEAVFKNMPGPQSTDNPHRKFGTIAFGFDAAPKLLDVNRVLLLYTAQT